MTNMLIETDLDKIEKTFDVDFGRKITTSNETEEIEQTYFPQFEQDLRDEASYMAKNYEGFIVLKKPFADKYRR